MEINVFHKTVVKTYQYPYAEKLNPKLHEIILQKAVIPDSGATMTEWKDGLNIKEFKTICDWVLSIIQNHRSNYDYHQGIRSDKVSEWPEANVPSNFNLEIEDLWGQYYKAGDHHVYHTHHPHHWSFVYYVNAPKGCAPLVFTDSNKKIFPKSGMLVLFHGWLRHHVPNHKCKEIRSIISGNFVYERGEESK